MRATRPPAGGNREGAMWNPIERYRQRQARRRVMPRAVRARTGRTTKVGIGALIVIVTAAAILEWRGGGAGEAQLVAAVRAEAGDPIPLIVAGARAHRFVFLADVAGNALPKRFAVRVIEALAQDPGLDAVALPVDSDLQPVIDRYIDSDPEDASILLARPRALREWEGTGRDFLDVYRAVWRLNQELGADRRIRIFAIDMEGWPGEAGTSPAQQARLFVRRDSVMAANIGERLLERDPRSRVLFFVEALHVLKTGGAHIQTGGAGRVEGDWLAARLRAQNPGEVFSVLVDAQPGRIVAGEVASYRGTRFFETLRRGEGLPPYFGVRATDLFEAASRPVRTATSPGITIDIVPPDYRLHDVADVYVLLGS
jgi:hypothetical protein